MKLVYNFTDDLVHVGDKVTLSDGKEVEVHYFRPPHKPESQGKVTVKKGGSTREYYASVIGATWILREDRGEI